VPGVSEPLLLVDQLGSMGAFVDRLSGCSYRSEAAVSGGGRLATAVDESQEPLGSGRRRLLSPEAVAQRKGVVQSS
jgi:hypothetical protein